MVERLIRAAFSTEVIATVALSQLVFISLIVSGIAWSKGYRLYHRNRLLAILGLSEVTKIRACIERLIRRGGIQGAELEGIHGRIRNLTISLYEIKKSTGAPLIRHRATEVLEKLKFPEILLSKGERAKLACASCADGEILLALFLGRELNRVYSLEAAARALEAGLVSPSGPKEEITIRRLRAAASPHFSRKVLGCIAKNTTARLRPLADKELLESRRDGFWAKMGEKVQPDIA